MTSDDNRRSQPGSWKPATAAWSTFRCGKCDQTAGNGSGTGMRRVQGLMTRVCPACKSAIDARRKQ